MGALGGTRFIGEVPDSSGVCYEYCRVLGALLNSAGV